MEKHTTTESLTNKIKNKINDINSQYYFDVQGSQPFTKITSMVDEAYLAKILTKLAVGSATVWWSAMEMKEILSMYKKSRKNKGTMR